MKKTMRQYSFTTRLKSLAVVFGIAMAFASCANEDVAQNPTNPNEDNDKNLTTFVAGDETKTRTSMDYNSGDFYWEAGDYIYVKDDNNVWQKSSNAPTSKVAAFKYKVPGKFTVSTSYKVYYLGKNSSGNDVTISSTQTQIAPDNTKHFGESGDYGTATATKITGKQQFQFTLVHQPAYLVFQPYTSNTILQNCYLTRIEVTSDNDIAETYTINTSTDNLDASAGSKKIELITKDWTWSSIYSNGFPLTNTAASVTTNGAYMVIKPGVHTLKIRYWVKEIATGTEGTITKILPSTTYASNTYYDMTANLNVRDYDGTHYAMWDAQQNYWYGHEWDSADPWQPTANGQNNPNYPKSQTADPNRWKSEAFPGPGVRHDASSPLFKTAPNVNEMAWYCMKGDPHWDDDEVWTAMGHLHKGGMWFLKKSKISGFTTEHIPDNPSGDMRTNWYPIVNTTSHTRPSDSEIGNYFYLPAMNGYSYGQLNALGSQAFYWSSSATVGNEYYAYGMEFSLGSISVNSSPRVDGLYVQAFE